MTVVQMSNLYKTVFLGTAIALTLNGGELLAQELSSESSLENVVTSSVEMASKTILEKNNLPSTKAADLSNNWMERVEWNIAQNPDQSLPVAQQENKSEKPEDPRVKQMLFVFLPL